MVRYRLHPYTPNTENDALINHFIESTKLGPEDDEIDVCFEFYSNLNFIFWVAYDEEEIANIGEEQSGPLRFKFARRIWGATWKVQHFDLLPDWLQDNEFLHTGHRPPLPSFAGCFKSIFQLHTETGNIWTHLYGLFFVLFAIVYFCFRLCCFHWGGYFLFDQTKLHDTLAR